MKQKTHSGAKKRVKVTANGKYIFSHSCKRHLLSDKPKKAKGRNKYGVIAHKTNRLATQRCLPYGV